MSATGKSSYIPTLDGLRAVAILTVVFAHSLNADDFPRLEYVGHLGVMIFFALSGFLITTRLLEEHRAKGRISLKAFYVRRVFRILPPALTYLGVVFILGQAGIIVCSWSAIRSALFLYTNYTAMSEAAWRIGHFWSLSVEEHFYLFWPALLILSGVKKGLRTAGGIAIAIVFWRMYDDRVHLLARLLHMPALIEDPYRTDLVADALLWGCCLAFLLLPPMRRRLNPALSTALAIVTAALMGYLYCFHVSHVTMLVHFLPTVLLGVIVTAPTSPIGRFLELAPMRFIGKLSYSIYIWQELFLRTTPARLPVAYVCIFACAYLSYRFVETPCIAYGRRLLSRNARLRETPKAEPADAEQVKI